jgi:hypothetical protein
MPHDIAVRRIRSEYLEMPGLRLTVEQAQRLCGVERTECKSVLDTLVEEKFLCVKVNGAYARATDGEAPHPFPAKADLRPHDVRDRFSRADLAIAKR